MHPQKTSSQRPLRINIRPNINILLPNNNTPENTLLARNTAGIIIRIAKPFKIINFAPDKHAAGLRRCPARGERKVRATQSAVLPNGKIPARG